MNILKDDWALYIYLFFAISIGWYYNHLGKGYVEKYDTTIMLLVETIVVLSGVTTALVYKHYKNPYDIIKKLYKISVKDYIIFILFALYGMSASLIGLEFLKHHDVAQIRISDFIISIPISAFGLYYFSSNPITTEKIFGLIAVAIGGYFFMR
tara:strand:+ start:290 stop:748 length:459 start_codon:yes stop_codon:yes gene_type:complete